MNSLDILSTENHYILLYYTEYSIVKLLGMDISAYQSLFVMTAKISVLWDRREAQDKIFM